MNRIETGTTGERWIRCLVFVGLCVVFGAWFAYDGWVNYPTKNLQWAMQKMPPQPPGSPPPKATANPNVTVKNIVQIRARLADPEASLSRSQLISILGEPAGENPEKGELYFIGPAIFAQIKLEGDVVRRPSDVQAEESREHGEAEINNQKRLAVILAVVAVIALIQLVRILTTRVILDDEGLNYNGRLVTWDAMCGLNAERYREKGWVDLEYRDGDETSTLRLDNYKVKAFKEIVNAICERKGFANPLHEPEESEPAPPPADAPGPS